MNLSVGLLGASVKARRQPWSEFSSSAAVALGIELGSSGLSSKGFYLQSYLNGPLFCLLLLF